MYLRGCHRFLRQNPRLFNPDEISNIHKSYFVQIPQSTFPSRKISVEDELKVRRLVRNKQHIGHNRDEKKVSYIFLVFSLVDAFELGCDAEMGD